MLVVSADTKAPTKQEGPNVCWDTHFFCMSFAKAVDPNSKK